VASMLDNVVYRDQQVYLSRDTTLLKSLLPGNHYHQDRRHDTLIRNKLIRAITTKL